MPTDVPPTVDTVVVVAPRLGAAPADRAYSTVTVGGEAIATAPRLDEALTATPGVQLFRRTSSAAANPTTQGISVRAIAGSGAGRALVTLDGEPLNDPFGGWVIWSGIPQSSIEGATIVRGAGAGPYGAGALTGVIQLAERTSVSPGGEYELHGAERGGLGGDAVYAVGDVIAAVSAERTNGWVPVRAGRGAADEALAFRSTAGSVRWSPGWRGGDLAFRVSGYEEHRDSGLAGAASRSTGASISAAMTGGETSAGTGWRLQGWARRSDLENSSVAVGAGRATTTPANDQYGTPASGYGFNAAWRGAADWGGWEVGGDARFYEGETRERFRYMAGAFTRDRVAGGGQNVAGLYGEVWRQAGPWLLTGGLRVDRWSAYDGKRVERDLATNLVTLNNLPQDRSGWEPTARIGVRLDNPVYVRAAAYAGFRAPTLNELHRPFRVGNDVTEANPALEPERLTGVEIGVGGEGDWRWSATLFANKLEKAITNVTIGVGPGTFPIAGFIPAGGVLRQRQNAGDIDAWGLEAELEKHWGEVFLLRLAGGYTRAKVDGGSAAPQLTGLRPAQTPQLTASAQGVWTPIDPLSLRAMVRYESARYDDDQNSRRLAGATTLDLRADWKINRAVTVYTALDNATDTAVETAQTGDGIESYDAPRTFRLGVILRP